MSLLGMLSVILVRVIIRNFIMLIVIMHCIVKLSVFMLNVIILSLCDVVFMTDTLLGAFMQSVVMPTAIGANVAAPSKTWSAFQSISSSPDASDTVLEKLSKFQILPFSPSECDERDEKGRDDSDETVGDKHLRAANKNN